MTTLNLSQQSAKTLDIEKRKLEAKLLPDVKRIFRNISIDARNLYKATGNLPSRELASNYNSDFTKEIRDIYRTTIKKFGFQIRKDVEKKHGLFFDAEYKSELLGLELKQSISVVDENINDKLDNINNEFALAATLFIANQSEQQTEFIEDTNGKMIETALLVGSLLYEEDLQKIRREGGNDNLFIKNKKTIIANNIKKNLDSKIDGRSELIVNQNVGDAESWGRQKEAELLNQSKLVSTREEIIKVSKTWSTILDSSTRTDHAIADGQVVDDVDGFFLVGGEQGKRPRDDSFSMKNKANCRCVAIYSV